MSIASKYFSRDQSIEIAAVVLNLTYTALYIAEIKFCFVFGFLGSILFVYLCFYVFMAIYGWVFWGDEFAATDWSTEKHLSYLFGGILIWGLSGFGLRKYSNSKLPFLDSFTTTFSVLATWLMVNLEAMNWWYWLIINALAIVLYLKRQMKYGALMFLVYWIMALIGLYKTYFH